MPDNTNQWSPDEAFWDQAWSDMERRLDRKRRPSPLWLWLLLPLMIAAGTWLWQSTDEPDRQVIDEKPSIQPIVADSDSPSAIGEEAIFSPLRSTDAPTGSSVDGIARPQPVTPPTTTGPTEIKLGDTRMGSARTSPRPNDAPADPAPLTNSLAVAPVPTLPPGLLATNVVLNLEARPAKAGIEPITRKPLGIRAFAGATYYPNATPLGGYVQVDYRFWLGGWLLPVALRFDRSVKSVHLTEDQVVLDALSPRVNGFVGQYPVYGDLTGVIQENGRGRLVTNSLSLRSGIGRTLGQGQRWTVTGGGELTYLLGGESPVLLPLISGGNLDAELETADLSFNQANSIAAFSPSAAANAPASTARRLLAGGWLQVEYQIGGRWAGQLGYTHFLMDTYKEGPLRADRNRISLGLGYRF